MQPDKKLHLRFPVTHNNKIQAGFDDSSVSLGGTASHETILARYLPAL
jgi:hypothetical protein